MVGSYRLLGRLGAGGMGVVYLAEDADGGQVAVKLLSDGVGLSPQLRSRLAREARSLRALSDPHVVRVVAVDTDAEVPYLVMNYVAGVPLDRAVPTGGLPPEQVRALGAQLAGALADAHAHGIVHRDVKPNNVVFAASGVTLVDFGIASLEDDGTTALTRVGAVLGSLAWLAPEVIAGHTADERSDVFGLGLVLGFMALGRHPFGSARPEALMYRIMHEAPDLTACPPEVRPVIEAALTRDSTARPDAHHMQQLLLGATVPAVATVASGPRRRRSAPVVLAVAGALVVAVVGAVAGSMSAPVEQVAATDPPVPQSITTASPEPPSTAAEPDGPPPAGILRVGMSLDEAPATGEDGPGICTYEGRISDLIIRTPGWRSPEGIGVGSTGEEVRAAYPNAVLDDVYGDSSDYYLLVDMGSWGYQFYVSAGVVDIIVYGNNSGKYTFFDC